ncbi:MAG: type II toxin-antitoxin system HicA family toxin [Candidatus Bathyarchaeales archaeon]
MLMMNEKGVRVVIPVHPWKDVKPGLIRAIIKEAGLKREEFFKILRQT